MHSLQGTWYRSNQCVYQGIFYVKNIYINSRKKNVYVQNILIRIKKVF